MSQINPRPGPPGVAPGPMKPKAGNAAGTPVVFGPRLQVSDKVLRGALAAYVRDALYSANKYPVPQAPAPKGSTLLTAPYIRPLPANTTIDVPTVRQITDYLNGMYPNLYSVTSADVTRVVAELKKGPFPKEGLAEYSLEYWYNYFFAELPGPHKLAYAAMAVNNDGEFLKPTAKDVAGWKTIFDGMLAKGFKAFQVADKLTADQVLDHACHDGEFVTTKNDLQKAGARVAFRGDGRLPDTIKSQGGTSRQTRVEALRVARNMTQPWHPFKNQGHKVWVRNGETNKDNCLFSTVSITPQFGVATKFPMLDALNGSCPWAVGRAVVMVRRHPGAPLIGPMPRPGPKVANGYLAAMQQGGLETLSLAASRTNVYCVRLRDVYNTQKYQQAPFPEYAATRVAWMDHLVWFAVTRIHYDEFDCNAGHLTVITAHKWLQDTQLLKDVLLKEPSHSVLQAFVTDVVRRGTLKDGVGGIVTLPDGVTQTPFEIVRVRELFIEGGVKAAMGQLTAPSPATPHAALPAPKKLAIPQAFTHGW